MGGVGGGLDRRAVDLQLASSRLLLHLSALAPVAPLSLDSPMRSCVSGLEALLEEVAEVALPKLSRPQQQRIQQAGDRARAEQVATVRCLAQTSRSLRQWAQHGSATAPALAALGERLSRAVERAGSELRTSAGALGTLARAVGEAERCRLRDSTHSTDESSSTGASASDSHSRRGSRTAPSSSVSPLDSLARGAAGREVAALVETLRLLLPQLQDSAEGAQAASQVLGRELRRELGCVVGLGGEVERAGAASMRLLQTAPYCLALQPDTAGGQMQGGGQGGGQSTRRSEYRAGHAHSSHSSQAQAPHHQSSQGSGSAGAQGRKGRDGREGRGQGRAGRGRVASPQSTPPPKPPFDLSLSMPLS
ncbi:hypothetical protein B484DRAFT_441276 [Ochromonadaceae sp. CCMP2298]|nr:hypothetical protein B484DRAFT_441276 [Ochromonadaceae sp. CCMP2298]